MDEDALTPSDKALQAIMLLLVDRHVRDHEPRKLREEPIEKILSRAGYTTADIARFLGKTQRAVQMTLQG